MNVTPGFFLPGLNVKQIIRGALKPAYRAGRNAGAGRLELVLTTLVF